MDPLFYELKYRIHSIKFAHALSVIQKTSLIISTSYAIFIWTYLALVHKFVSPFMDGVDLNLYIIRRFLDNWSIAVAFKFMDNEHRPVLPIYFFAADYQYFGALGLFLQITCLITIGVIACCCVQAGRLGRRRADRIAAWLAIVAVFVWPGHWENLIWAKQIHMYLSMGLLATALAAAMTLDTAVEQALDPRRPAMVAGGAVFLSGLCFAYGFTGWPLLFGYAVIRRWPRKIWAILLTWAALAALLLWIGHRPQPRHTSALSALARPQELAEYIGVFLGAPIYSAWGRDALAAAMTAGLSFVVATAGLVAWGLWGRLATLGPAGRFGALLMSFAVSTALIVGLGRLDFGPEQAASSRYLIIPAIGWIGVAMVTADRLSAWNDTIGPSIGGCVAALLFAAAPFWCDRAVEKMSHFDRHNRAGAAATLIGAEPDADQEQLHPDGEHALRLFDAHRLNNKGVFRLAWPSWLGRSLVDDGRRCAGDVGLIEKTPKGMRVLGRVESRALDADAMLALTNADGAVIGFGAALRPRRLGPPLQDDGWVGFIPRDAGPIQAWALKNGRACRLGALI